MTPQRPAAALVRPNPTVNGSVAHDGLPFKLFAAEQSCSGLNPLRIQRLNDPKLRRPISPIPARATLSSAGFLHRMARPIAVTGTYLISLLTSRYNVLRCRPRCFAISATQQTLSSHRGNFITFLPCLIDDISSTKLVCHWQLESKTPNTALEPTPTAP